jgi:alcohol dehydrogenase (cytochrome c)
MNRWAVIAVAALSLLPAQVHYEDILRSPREDWLTYNGDFAGRRHSPLDQINRRNVASLVPVWMHHVEGARHLETTPLVARGIMYVTDANRVEALDTRTGRRIWSFHVEGVKTQRVCRGAALLGDRVYLVTGDAHLIALHAASGSLLWDHEYASATNGYFSTMAPLVVKDKVLVGVGGGGSGQRGFVAALSASTGEEVWRFWTVPRRGEPGGDTWGDFPPEMGGAPTWTTGSFDPELNLVYWPTGNPWPDYYGVNRPGDNLYSDCVLALDADTGNLKWHFQFTPHDTHDWDANETLTLIDAPFRGTTRKLLVQANRNGYYYVLDRTNGAFLHAAPFVDKLNWATGVDVNGRPQEVLRMEPSPAGTKVCPCTRGAANWMSPSYDPKTGLLYVVTLEQCDIYTSSAKDAKPSTGFHGTGSEQIPAEPGRFYLRALDSVSGKRKWEYKMTGPATMWGGTVATAGGVVFTANDDGDLVALDSAAGTELWHFNTGHSLFASPITFQSGGRQYVTIAAETDIITFALFQVSR